MSESLENFTNIVKEDIKEAKTLFFSEAFKEEYLKDRREEKSFIISFCWGETGIRSWRNFC